MKRPKLKNKSNNTGKPADKTVYKKWRNLVVKLIKEAKSFWKKREKKMANNTNKTICFGNFTNIFSIKKVFIINKNLLLKLKEMQHQVRK